ncbi:hypothetical protein NKI88_07695 [Mesorhizobium sp. M0317]|uniref:hypothetical protein n=1 Tax=unclassified Mesorhizobium TaxID=325217 RepID=UPI003337D3C0
MGKHLQKLKGILTRHLGRGPFSLLEFASRYGCVTRHLVKGEDIDLVSSDYPQAISFLANEFKVKAIQSRSIPEEAVLAGSMMQSLRFHSFPHADNNCRDGWFVCSALCGLVAFRFHN